MFGRIRIRHASTLVGLLAVAAIGTACDEQPGEVLEPDAELRTSPQARGSAATEVFTANLRPLNAELSFRPVRGSAQVKVTKGRITVRVNAQGLEPGIPHPQHIHGKMGVGECPTMAADDNGDGVVDVVEGLPDYGGILVTLDSDLTDGSGTQVDGLPTADEDGTIHYEQSASLEAVQAGASMDLDLAKRHIVLHGVDPDLQDSALSEARSLGGLPAWLTLPVACGELVPEGRGRAAPSR